MNTGKSSEALFQAHWASHGKAAYLERRIDAAHVRGMNPGLRALAFPAQPSDYILTFEGRTHYCEVKSCQNKTAFPFRQIEKGQWAAATLVTAAGGSYVFFLHNLNTNLWYCVPAKIILAIKKSDQESVKWDWLERGHNIKPGDLPCLTL